MKIFITIEITNDDGLTVQAEPCGRIVIDPARKAIETQVALEEAPEAVKRLDI